MYEIRPTVQGDFEAVCNRVNDKTVKAFTVLQDNEPVAIAGITIEQGRFLIFSDIKEGATAPKMTIWKLSKQLAEHIKTFNLPAVATSSNGKFLKSIGFEHIGEVGNKETYRI